jgi:hypothetical protein
MGDLESQEEDAPQRVSWYKPMAWLGMIRTHRRDECWSASLWQTFFLGDHVSTCTTQSGAKKAHDWAVEQLADLFRTTRRVKTQQVAGTGVNDVVTSSLLPTWLMLWGRCHWCWTYSSRMSVGQVHR